MRHFTHSGLPVVVVLGILGLCVPAATAKIIHVPTDQPTVQAGIDASVNGDTVLVSPGTYKENINFNGKAITVKSQSGPGVTIIDGGQLGPVVIFATGEGRSTVLTGFTIQNGIGNFDASYVGGGIKITSASPNINGNVITLNNACSAGGGIAVDGGGPLIQGNIIQNNIQLGCSGGGGGGGGIYVSGATNPNISGNVISYNSFGTGGGIAVWGTTGLAIQSNVISGNVGGGIYLFSNSGDGVLLQNLITGNQGTGIYWGSPPQQVVNNTIADNATGYYYYGGSEIYGSTLNNQVTIENNLLVATGATPAFSCDYYDSGNPPVFSNNDVFSVAASAYGGVCPDATGTNGNISADPFFVALLSGNFHLQSGSPAVDAGDNSAPGLRATDFDGDPRVLNSTIDIGADEYSTTTALAVSSYSLHYGSQEVGTTSSPELVTLTNQSSTKANLKLIATGSDYTQTNNCGNVLLAGSSCQINVSFAPVAGGTRTSVLGVMSNLSGNPLAVNLTGTGLAPAASLGSTYFFFPNVTIGGSSALSTTLTNTGQAPLTIGSIVSSNADFVPNSDCPFAPSTLEAGSFCTITVTWTPTFIGYDTGTVTVTDNANPSTQTINLFGSAYGAGVATLVPSSLTFPDTLIGNSSQPLIATLTNTGTGPLGNITLYSSQSYSSTSDCPPALLPGASCTISITFTPYYPGSNSGYTYVYNDSPNAGYLSTSGTGLSPVPTVESLSPGSAAVGSSDTYVTITGTGFVSGSQVQLNGTTIATSYGGLSTQISFYMPAVDLVNPGTVQISVFNPSPGGGTSSALPFTIYTPINYASKASAFNYRQIAGTNLDLYYYGSAQVTSPFPIQFGGGSFTNLYVGAGGTIAFAGSFSNEYNDAIPTTQTPMLVAPFWSNLYLWGAGTNDHDVFWQVNGTAPDRELVIEWRNVAYCCSSDSQHTVTFQVVFFEGSSNILFNYGDTIFGGQYSGNDNGATATSGVQVAWGQGTQYSYNSPSLISHTALLWYPNAPTVSLSSTTLDFGYHQVGSGSLPQKVTLTNGGLVPLQINSITTDNPDYTQSNSCGTTVPPGKSCTIQVKFKPSQPTVETATLTISDNAANSPQTVALSGIGAIAPVVVFPIQMNFGSVTVGSSATLPVTLANASNQPMTIQQIAVSPAVFTQTNNCGTALSAGASCTIQVTFTPTQKGSVKGAVSMGLNGKPVSAKVKMIGTGS